MFVPQIARGSTRRYHKRMAEFGCLFCSICMCTYHTETVTKSTEKMLYCCVIKQQPKGAQYALRLIPIGVPSSTDEHWLRLLTIQHMPPQMSPCKHPGWPQCSCNSHQDKNVIQNITFQHNKYIEHFYQ